MPTGPDVLTGLRVLIVEDEGLIAMELSDRLSRKGMTVVAVVDSADRAVAAASSLRPEVVLMDIRIKGDRDGVEAAGEISRTADIPIVFLTSHSDRATLDRAKGTAPYGYVLKPFQERELLVAIEMAVHRHSLERQLKESERKYVATLASISDGVVATDLNERITFMNPVAEALTGWSFEDARGLTATDVIPAARDVQGVDPVNPIGQALRENRSIRFDDVELFLFTKSNEAIPIDDCASPIVDDRGRVIGGVTAFRDIRYRRLAEDALRQAQEELSQSQKMESVGRLAAGIAHDFNNLLTIINGCSELALESEHLDDTTRDLLREVVGAGARASTLTRQFLAFGRKQMLQPRLVDLTALVTDLTAMLRRLIGEDVELTTTSQPQPVFVLADPGQLEHVIVNLAVNARDAMRSGGTLTIATSHTTIEAGAARSDTVEPGRYAVLTVSDSGRGIEESVKNQMFEPYFTTQDSATGSGLGLATVYGIVKQSDGFVEVDSEPGRGTTFTIYIPLVENAAPVSDPPEYVASHVVERGKECILLVEDEDSVRTLLGKILGRQGYTVITAEDGESALRAFEARSRPIDLMRDPVLIERLSAGNASFRALYMSGYTSDATPLAPGTAFIQKPFTPSVLARTVRDLLDESR